MCGLVRYILTMLAVLDPTLAGYVAGLIDGEETVTLSRLHRNENRRLVVSISNNDLAMLQYVQGVIGAGRITSKRKSRPHHAASYTYQVSSRQALDLLEQIAHLLRSYKAKRAVLALAEYVHLTPRNGKYAGDLRARRADFETRFLAIRP